MGEVKRRLPRAAVVVAIVVAGVLVLTGAAIGGYRLWQYQQNHATFTEATMTTIDIEGDSALIITPDAAATTPTAVIVAHGSDSDRDVTRSTYMASFTQDFLDAGWIVASSDADGEAWGTPESQSAYVELAHHLTDHLGVERIVLVSFSMGAIAGLNATASGDIPGLVGWVGINPVTDMEAIHADERFTHLIDAAMDESGRAAVDPSALTADAFTVPLLVFTGDADASVPGDVHAKPFADRVGAELVQCEGNHTAPDCFRADTIIAAFG